ncbi:GNAT family N-acetyltransferase [Streptomyces johnsoniae]|uniref:GNAT family N-acetyltransferase n=1 Tax=Streptomyces johnsoniae TaxID=3075532 RepID=A0ABU2RZ43_9ACTN|nr:GNAT family N-acetyltransferase [Streptomyces sp. DSM 41886]MDT0441907.1 GNAT family N-acetyltransferase [Streptomyces sp. DSM 41886]
MKIRQGGLDDLPVILGMLDGAVAWLAGRGRTGQWGSEPWSARPRAVERVREIVASGAPWIAEIDGEPAGSLTLTPGPGPYIAPVDEPEVYVHLLVTDRRFAGRGVGAALLAHAVAETRRQGVDLLRVDCYAGDDGRLVAYYRDQGFTPTERFSVGDWPGQLLARRMSAEPQEPQAPPAAPEPPAAPLTP